MLPTNYTYTITTGTGHYAMTTGSGTLALVLKTTRPSFDKESGTFTATIN
jgi:hypothetical protein